MTERPPRGMAVSYMLALVASGHTKLLGPHNPNDVLRLAFSLQLRNHTALQRLLQALDDPASPNYHRYLPQQQFNQQFAPTGSQEAGVIQWLRAGGLTVMQTYPNHLIVDVDGQTAQIERLLHITINDYRVPVGGAEQTFFGPATNPVVPAPLGAVVQSITGLDSFPHIVPFRNGAANGKAPNYPQDFANAYNVNPLWNAGYTGSGQNIGIVLWTDPPSDSTLQHFKSKAGADVATVANGRLKIIPVDGGSSVKDEGEAAMDIEYSSGLAPGATINYYEAPTDSKGNATERGLEDALNRAGTDANRNLQISNSWGGCESASASDSFVKATSSIFEANQATGHEYFFASGDNGSWCDPSGIGLDQDPYPDYPASSPYVTSVGGTRLNRTASGASETSWAYCAICSRGNPEGSGGGYSTLFARPSWQKGSGLAGNGKRGYPDIAADADPQTGAYVCYGADATCSQIGGTSLASPLWAGMIAVTNSYLAAQGKAVGFLAPTLYRLADSRPKYSALHDITSGINGAYQATKKWDEVTGWGSPNLYNLARDLAAIAQGTK